MMKKKLAVILAMVLAAALLAACSEGEKGKYERGQSLMAKRQYSEAAAVFEELGSYEESAKLAMYCKAAAAGEAGQYETAYSIFRTLGDYKESRMMIVYYQGREQEARGWEYYPNAIEYYQQVPGFLDTIDRVEACRNSIYEHGVTAGEAGQYETAYSIFRTLGDHKDGQKTITYYRGREQEARGWEYYPNAIWYYQQVPGFLDTDSRVEVCRNDIYEHGVAAMNEKRYEDAILILQNVDGYKDSADKIAACRTAILDRDYDAAVALKNEGKYEQAIRAFEALNGHKDSKEQIAACKTAILDRNYDDAVALKDAGKYEEAIIAFEALNGHKDSKEQIAACKTAILDRDYDAAVALKDAGKYEEAIIAFEALNGHKDSKEQIAACKTAILDRDYDAAVALKDAGKYEEAIAAFEALNGHKDSAEQIAACQEAIKERTYQEAAALYTEGDYDGAYQKYSSIRDYKDVDTLLAQDNHLKAAAWRAQHKVGSYVTFGHYEQDGDTANGQEPIEWLVLDVQGGKALLLSRYGLDAKPYNTEWVDITWEKCTLRTWLNGTFLNKAFTSQEQKAILTTNVDNSSSQGYSEWSTSGGNDTQDKVFLLSYAEANKYLGVEFFEVDGATQNKKSRAAPTAYAQKAGAWTSDSDTTADGAAAWWWWLRSRGYYQYYVADVSTDGSLRSFDVFNDSGCVRPALWINLESDIF